MSVFQEATIRASLALLEDDGPSRSYSPAVPIVVFVITLLLLAFGAWVAWRKHNGQPALPCRACQSAEDAANNDKKSISRGLAAADSLNNDVEEGHGASI